MDSLYTRKTLAAYLSVTPRTIDNLRAKGLPHLMVGDSPRFKLPEVEEWLKANPRKTDEPLSFEELDAADAADALAEREQRQEETEELGRAIRAYPDPHRV
jgi:excisionase family DNA binding protein